MSDEVYNMVSIEKYKFRFAAINSYGESYTLHHFGEGGINHVAEGKH